MRALDKRRPRSRHCRHLLGLQYHFLPKPLNAFSLFSAARWAASTAAAVPSESEMSNTICSAALSAAESSGCQYRMRSTARSRSESLEVSCTKEVSKAIALPLTHTRFSSPTWIQLRPCPRGTDVRAELPAPASCRGARLRDVQPKMSGHDEVAAIGVRLDSGSAGLAGEEALHAGRCSHVADRLHSFWKESGIRGVPPVCAWAPGCGGWGEAEYSATQPCASPPDRTHMDRSCKTRVRQLGP